jgi:hypothetical protein
MRKILFSLLLFIFVVVLRGAVPVFAVGPVRDLGEYENGDLNGQDGWSSAWNSLLVQDDDVLQGTKYITNQKDFLGMSYKELGEDYLENGVLSMKIKIENNFLAENLDLFGLYKGEGEDFIALLRFANEYNEYKNRLLLSRASSAEVINLGSLSQGEWHTVSLAWRKSDFMIRVKIDDQEWSEWMSSEDRWEQGKAFGVKISMPDERNYGNFYYADIKSSIGTEILPPTIDIIDSGIVIISDPALETPAATTDAEPSLIEVIVEFILDVIGLGDPEVPATPTTDTIVVDTATDPLIESVPAEIVPSSDVVLDPVVETVSESVVPPGAEPVIAPIIQEDPDGSTTIIAI